MDAGGRGSLTAYAAGIDPRRQLPSVERVLASLETDMPHALRAQVARGAVDAARERVELGQTVTDGRCRR